MIHSESKLYSFLTTALSLSMLAFATTNLSAQGFQQRQAVGGIVINPTGMIRTATEAERLELAKQLRQINQGLPGDLKEAAELRMVSLKGLQAEIAKSQAAGKSLPAEVEYMAGLQRIEYVFVDKENHDVILAGPAEPWELRADGFVVGSVTGGATMRLADLMVALQSVENARQQGITCSIEPTDEGRRRLQKLLSRTRLRPGQNPAALEGAMKEAFGPQMIYLSGIPSDSLFARTLVAADYEMKRVAMGLTPSPVSSLPSYLEMSRNSQHTKNQNPRWWMACNYDAIGKSEDGLSWKLSGQGVQTKTEQDIVNQDGSVRRGGIDKMAQAWADKMTGSYAELSRKMPVFSELQNMMDCTVVATLIVQEQLATKAGLDLTMIQSPNQALELASYTTPKAVEPHCSFIRGRAGWVVTASGGVDINGFQIVQNQVTDENGSQQRKEALAASTTNHWWWNK